MNKLKLTIGIVLTVIGTLMVALGFAFLTVFAITNPLSGLGMYRGFAAGILITAAGIMMIVCDKAYGFTAQNICIVVILALAIALAAVGKNNPYRSNIGYFAALSELIAIVYSVISREKTSKNKVTGDAEGKHKFKKLGKTQDKESTAVKEKDSAKEKESAETESSLEDSADNSENVKSTSNSEPIEEEEK